MIFKKIDNDVLWYEESKVVDAPSLEKAIAYLATLMKFENYHQIKVLPKKNENLISLNNIQIFFHSEKKNKVLGFLFNRVDSSWNISPDASENITIINKKLENKELSIQYGKIFL